MPRIQSLHVRHVRAHPDFTLKLAPDVTVITGANGSGKTSLLEALYVALQGSSFKGSDKDIVERTKEWYRIDVGFDDGTVRTVKFDSRKQTGRKQFNINDKNQYRLPPALRYPVVLFEPDDLRLLNGSPERRRRFIDQFISQIDVSYASVLRRYERSLRQRNALLKKQASSDDFFAWNLTLSEYGATIIEKRIHFIEQLNERLNETYHAIAHKPDTVSMRYSFSAGDSIQQKLLSELHHATQKDLVLGFTSVGPHRHDVLFEFNGSPALSVASRGEVRSIVLALKFLEIDIIEQVTSEKPVVLLDDVFSELDEERQKQLTTLTKSHQIIITSATSGSRIPASIITKLE
ncbi:MAG TPA: DNA replication and repair protein RecF [Candidatus Saccharimonadales bacterium]|nr:DNA replication and repair protein RecF [Candidatus Saccharimonadales bacterium]